MIFQKKKYMYDRSLDLYRKKLNQQNSYKNIEFKNKNYKILYILL